MVAESNVDANYIQEVQDQSRELLMPNAKLSRVCLMPNVVRH
jgi:hypothetical protein